MKIKTKLKHFDNGTEYPAGSIIEVPDDVGQKFCATTDKNGKPIEPVAEPYNGTETAANA